MHDKWLPLCPTVGLVVVVHPGQHVDLRIRGVEYHGSVGLVDAHGIQILALGALDHLVVQARCIGPLAEAFDELANLLLVALLDVREGPQKITGKSNRHSATSSGNRSSSGSGALRTASAKNTCQPALSNRFAPPVSWSSRTARRHVGQASSAVATISPSSVANSKPGSGSAFPRSAILRHRSRISGATSSIRESV